MKAILTKVKGINNFLSRIDKSSDGISSGVLFSLLYFAVNLITARDYGVTWDFTYHFNAGLWHLGLPLTQKGFTMFSWGPLPDVMPVLSYILFYKKLHLLAFDTAYNLFSLSLGSLGIGLIYVFSRNLWDRRTALVSVLTLALLPRYAGHLHNNMKDIPQSVLFTLSLYLLYRLIKSPSVLNLLAAAGGFSLAFNTKLNSLFIPVIGLIWLAFCLTNRTFAWIKVNNRLFRKKIILIGAYFVLAPAFGYILWMIFWKDPWFRLIDQIHSARTTTINLPVLYYGKIYFSGVNIPWHYPYGMLLAVTPLLVLITFVTGLIYLLFSRKKNEESVLLLLWFFVPLLRFFLPGMIVIDDIRHFMEVIFPFSIISAAGFWIISDFFLKIFNKSYNNFRIKKSGYLSPILLIIYSGYLLYQLVLIHPYETSYFGEATGGIKGAASKFDIEFWASSYKHALEYLNRNAPLRSKITVAMVPDIALLYLRPDLAVNLNSDNMTGANEEVYQRSDYTVILNRQSFFDWYGVSVYMKNHSPVYILGAEKVPLVYIYKNSKTN